MLELALEIANKRYDGHLTIMKFTTNYKVCFGTPDNRQEVDQMATGATLEEALRNAIVEDVSVYKMTNGGIFNGKNL